MAKVYQNIPLEGVKWENPNRVESKFWNQGKWDNFIAPILPIGETFVEMGCNAGMFLKLAEDWGFKRVVGIEKDRTPVREGMRYRDSIGYHYNIIKRTVGGEMGESGDFDIDEMPIADVTLMSTFHYYVDINTWIKYIDRLRTKSRYVLIVSRPDVVKRLWLAQAQMGALNGYFKEWEMVGSVDGVSKDGDPSPRDMFSVLYKSPLLERLPIKEIRREPNNGQNMNWAMLEFAKLIAKDSNIEPLDTPFYKAWRARKEGLWDEETVKRFVQGKFKVMKSVKENGIREAALISGGNKLADSGHRVAILEALGYNSVIVRRI